MTLRAVSIADLREWIAQSAALCSFQPLPDNCFGSPARLVESLWLSLTPHTKPWAAAPSSKAPTHWLYTTCPVWNSRVGASIFWRAECQVKTVEHLGTQREQDIYLGAERPNKDLNESDYWTISHMVRQRVQKNLYAESKCILTE